MIVKHPEYGIGKVIKIEGVCELVYFFEANKDLHDGSSRPGSCEDNHGWWFSHIEVAAMEYLSPLGVLIGRRYQGK